MPLWKNPPKAKVYEALSAVADGRVILEDGNRASVLSSKRDKGYVVQWSEGFTAASSNDNASVWQGYIGYPIIAVLLAAKAIDYNADTAKLLSNVEWNTLNKEFKRDYDKAVDSVLDKIEADGGSRESIVSMVDKIYADLLDLKLEKLTKSRA